MLQSRSRRALWARVRRRTRTTSAAAFYGIALEPTHQNWNGAVNCRVIAELAEVILTPAQYGPNDNGTCMRMAEGERGNTCRQPLDLHGRNGTIKCGVVTELTPLIPTPA